MTKFPVPMRLWDTPVPIPNTMVKTQAADGTILVTVWESRWMLDSWGYSSVGRAPALQAGGQEFESPYLHLIIQKALNYQMEKTLGIYSQKSFSFDKRIFFEYP